MLLALLNTLNLVLWASVWYLGLKVYGDLPDDANVPMQFGIYGQINWTMKGRAWVFLYPGISTSIFLSSFVVLYLPKNGDNVKKTTLDITKFLMAKVSLVVQAMMLLILFLTPTMGKEFKELPAWAPSGLVAFLAGSMSMYIYSMAVLESLNVRGEKEGKDE
eukprot:jgi/Bigna1/77081/fgenesh1_pg.45_\